MIKSIIVDDEKKARTILSGLLKAHCPEIEVIGEADSVISAEKLIREKNPDLVFLDIEMPFGNGFDLLEKTRDLTYDVIFTTAYNHYAIKAIRISALDYLLKPIDPDELVAAVKRFVEVKRNENILQNQINYLLQEIKSGNTKNNIKKIAIPSIDGISFIEIDDIIRCEADANYTRIFTVNGQPILVSKTLKDYEDLLEEYGFVRVHHHNLINMNHVQKYIKGEGGYVIMTDGSSVEVSRRKKSEFLEKLTGI